MQAQNLEDVISGLRADDLAKLAGEYPEYLGGSAAELDLTKSFILNLKDRLSDAFAPPKKPPFDKRWSKGLKSIAGEAAGVDLPDVESRLLLIRELTFPDA